MVGLGLGLGFLLGLLWGLLVLWLGGLWDYLLIVLLGCCVDYFIDLFDY
jgi:hypothetical protein